MENVPIKQAFGALKWWTALKPLDRLVSFLAAIFIASTVINFYQYKEISRIQNEKNIVEKENLNARVECEQRVATVMIKERNRSDSLQQEKLQRLFITRTQDIKNANEKIKTVLK